MDDRPHASKRTNSPTPRRCLLGGLVAAEAKAQCLTSEVRRCSCRGGLRHVGWFAERVKEATNAFGLLDHGHELHLPLARGALHHVHLEGFLQKLRPLPMAKAWLVVLRIVGLVGRLRGGRVESDGVRPVGKVFLECNLHEAVGSHLHALMGDRRPEDVLVEGKSPFRVFGPRSRLGVKTVAVKGCDEVARCSREQKPTPSICPPPATPRSN